MSSATICCDTQSKGLVRVIWNTFNYLLVPSASLLNKFAYNYNDLVLKHILSMLKGGTPSLPFKHSACIWSYYGMVIDTYHFMDQSRCTRNDVPSIEWNSYVVQMHRNKRYGKAEKNETDSRALNQGYKL